MTDPFIDLLRWAGFLVGASASFALTWKRRAKWEPHISDVPDAPSKVGGLINALFLGAIWFDAGNSFGLPSLQDLTKIGGAVTLVGLLVYLFLSTVYIYDREVAVSPNVTSKIKIIGGLWPTRAARVTMMTGKDTQSALAEAGNNPDLVWPRPARALAQILFLLSYFALVCGGSIALSAVVLLNYRAS